MKNSRFRVSYTHYFCISLHTLMHCNQPIRLLSLVEECFSEEPQDGNEEKEDKSVQVIRPWFKQPQPPPQLQRPQRQLAEHIPPKAVLQQLVAGKDDLPACVIFYPISNQPHSIQGTWVTSKSENFFSVNEIA